MAPCFLPRVAVEKAQQKEEGGAQLLPLFCTIAQTGQVFDVYHRPGNVHDSHGAKGLWWNVSNEFGKSSRI